MCINIRIYTVCIRYHPDQYAQAPAATVPEAEPATVDPYLSRGRHPWIRRCHCGMTPLWDDPREIRINSCKWWSTSHLSLDWFKGKFTGNPHI